MSKQRVVCCFQSDFACAAHPPSLSCATRPICSFAPSFLCSLFSRSLSSKRNEAQEVTSGGDTAGRSVCSPQSNLAVCLRVCLRTLRNSPAFARMASISWKSNVPFLSLSLMSKAIWSVRKAPAPRCASCVCSECTTSTRSDDDMAGGGEEEGTDGDGERKTECENEANRQTDEWGERGGLQRAARSQWSGNVSSSARPQQQQQQQIATSHPPASCARIH